MQAGWQLAFAAASPVFRHPTPRPRIRIWILDEKPQSKTNHPAVGFAAACEYETENSRPQFAVCGLGALGARCGFYWQLPIANRGLGFGAAAPQPPASFCFFSLGCVALVL